MSRMLFLDVETTGLSPEKGDRIVEIALVEMIDRELTGNNFHKLINPEREIPEAVIKIHGITNERVKDEPTFPEINESLHEYIFNYDHDWPLGHDKQGQLVAHNAEFDVKFMNYELGNALKVNQVSWVMQFCGPILCTKKMARKMDNAPHNAKGYRLDDLKAKYNIDIDRELHGALIDATILAHVYLEMTKDWYI